jgi:hypothetical protein
MMLFMIWFTKFQQKVYEKSLCIKVKKPHLEASFIEHIAGSYELETELLELRDFIVKQNVERSQEGYEEVLSYNAYIALKNRKNLPKVYQGAKV